MLFRSLLCALALLALGQPVSAGQFREGPKAVLELFTSQGCSSCPEADAMLEELGQRQDVIALAYHVDYWDYIGWQDTFGAKEHSKRQRDYAAAWGSSRIFTPQLVVNGDCGVVGNKRHKVDAALESATIIPLDVDLAEAGNDTLDVRIAGSPDNGSAEAVVWLVTYIDRAEVEIERGENQGRKIAYTHIVTGRQVLGRWDPQEGATLKLRLGEVLAGPANGAAILVQQDRGGLPGPIIGAASFTR